MVRSRRRVFLFIVLTVIVIGIFLVRASLSPERLRAQVVAALQTAIGAPIDVESVSLSLFKGVVSVTGINVHSMEKSSVIAHTDARIEFRTLSLLSHTPDIRRVTLTNSRIRLERHPDGTWNFGSLAAQRSRSGDVAVPALSIEDAVLEVRSDVVFAAGTPQIFRGIHISLEPTEGGPFVIEGRMNDPSWGTFTIDGTVSRSFDDVQVSVVRRGLVLGPGLRARFSRTVQSTWDEVEPSGSVDLEGGLRIGSEGITYRLGVDCKGLGLMFREFPYPVQEIYGRIDLDNRSITIRDVRASAGSAILRIAGSIVGYATENPEMEVSLNARGLAFDAALKKALEKSYLKYWNAFQPAGTADIDLSLKRTPGAPDLDVGVKVKLNDAELTYVGLFDEDAGRPLGFPYTLEKIRGELVAEPGDAHFDLQGRTGREGVIQIHGYAKGPGKYPEIRVDVDGKDVALDDKLRSALDPKARATFDRFRLSGKADVKATITQPAGPNQHTQTEVDAILKDAALTFDGFPYPLEKVSGSVHILGDDATITGVVAHNGPAEFHVDAHVVGPGDDAARDIRVDATNVPLNLAFKNAIAVVQKSVADLWDELAAQGTADFHYEETRAVGPNERVRSRGTGRFVHGSARYAPFPFPVSEIEGTIRFDGDHVEILDAHGVPQTGGRVRMDGDIRGKGDSIRILIDLAATGLVIDSTFEEAVRSGKMSSFGRVLDELHPAGTTGMRYRYVEEPGSEPRTLLHVDPEGLRVESKLLPYPATDIRLAGEAPSLDLESIGDGSGTPDPGKLPAWAAETSPGITLIGDHLVVNALEGKMGMGTFQLHEGTAELSSDGIDRLQVTVDASELPVDDRVYAIFAPNVAEALAKVKAAGKIALSGLHAGAWHDDGRWHVELEGDVGLDDFRVSTGVDIEKMNGTIKVSEADLFGSTLRIDADVSNMDLQVLGRKVSKVSARLMGRPSTFLAYRISGDFYGGQIVQRDSKVLIRLGKPTQYEGHLGIVEVDAEQLAADLFPGQSDVKGTARTNIDFHGSGSSIVDLEASGALRVRDGRLLRLPLIDSLLRLLSIKSRPAFRDMDVEFAVRDGVVDFQRFDFSSLAMSLEGTGTLDMDGTLDLIFKTTIAPDLKLWVIDWVLDWLKGTFFAVHVYGPIENPRSALTNFILRATGDRTALPKEPKEPPLRLRPIPTRF
ncbi:MAG: hypothetical protein HYR85_01545 [Planctomycetes bacterium]|nr:hypothetical protein [Planctomycetota bacterium]MBI3843088.1 hypothetical protein [Planctomycetota bacterium]